MRNQNPWLTHSNLHEITKPREHAYTECAVRQKNCRLCVVDWRDSSDVLTRTQLHLETASEGKNIYLKCMGHWQKLHWKLRKTIRWMSQEVAIVCVVVVHVRLSAFESILNCVFVARLKTRVQNLLRANVYLKRRPRRKWQQTGFELYIAEIECQQQKTAWSI